MVGQGVVLRGVVRAVTGGVAVVPAGGGADAASTERGRGRQVWTFLVLLAALGCLLQLAVGAVSWSVEPLVDGGPALVVVVVGLLASFALAEKVVVHIPLGRNTYTLTLSDIPLVVGLFALGPVALVIVRVLGPLGPMAFRLHHSPRKLVFNLTWYWVEVCAALLVWHAVGGSGTELRPRSWLGACAVTVVVDLLGTVLISSVIAVDTGGRPALRKLLAESNPAAALVNASAALVIVYVATVDWRALWTVGVVVAVLVFAQQSSNRMRRRSESLERLGRFTGEIGGQLDVESAATSALAWIVRTLNAEFVELVLTQEFAGDRRAWRMRDDGTLSVPTGEGAAEALRPWLVDGRLLVRRGERDRGLATAARGVGVPDAMLMTLRGDGQELGTLLVGHRLGDVERFGDSDLGELVALGNHLSVTLRNARRADLIRENSAEQLRQSLHDELTGAPNRRFLEQRLAARLEQGGPATTVSLDLDRFKDINDTLGHATGDLLLCLVANRLRAIAPADAVVARLGGDEYAVLLMSGDDATTGYFVTLVHNAFAAPFELDALQVTVEASLGVAHSGQGDEPVDLLRRADIAMFAAKERRTGVEVYRQELEVGGTERLTLLTDLRAAIRGGELLAHYQPKVRVHDGVVLGAEALVRWTHPQRGAIFPDQFIPVAEHSGLITPLTFVVLRQALEACSRWRRNGRDMGVAVNISPRSLHESGFVDEVTRTVAESDVPTSAVTLEITESNLMTDPERGIQALDRLRAHGFKLSVDDLGTGYSSLAYLQRLPVTEVKIDRSFLRPGAEGADPFAIVGAVVDLGHRLGCDVVAEGVEDESTWRRLQALGCDNAQGYWMSRPLAPADFDSWLEAWRPEDVAALRPIG